MEDLGKRGTSAVVGGLIGYGIGALVNPVLAAHSLPPLPPELTVTIGGFIGDKATIWIRNGYNAAIEKRRTKKALKTLQKLAIEAADFAALSEPKPEEIERARGLQQRIETVRARALSEHDEFTIEKLEKAVDDYTDEVRSMSGNRQ